MDQKNVTTDTKTVWNIIKKYFKNLFSFKLENLIEMYNFLDSLKPSKLSQEEVNNLNRLITTTTKETEIVIKCL